MTEESGVERRKCVQPLRSLDPQNDKHEPHSSVKRSRSELGRRRTLVLYSFPAVFLRSVEGEGHALGIRNDVDHRLCTIPGRHTKTVNIRDGGAVVIIESHSDAIKRLKWVQDHGITLQACHPSSAGWARSSVTLLIVEYRSAITHPQPILVVSI